MHIYIRICISNLNRYRFNSGILIQEVLNKLKWADGVAIKNEIDTQILDLLGPKTEDDLAPVSKQAKQQKDKQTKVKKSEAAKEGELNSSLYLKMFFLVYFFYNEINC